MTPFFYLRIYLKKWLYNAKNNTKNNLKFAGLLYKARCRHKRRLFSDFIERMPFSYMAF